MVNLYVASVESAGKTALCAGIGKKLLSRGEKVGFFKPVQISGAGGTDESGDAAFVKEVLELTDPPELLSPIQVSLKDLWQNLTENAGEFTKKIKTAYTKVSRDKDIVIMEGLSGLSTDNVSTLACYRIVEALDAKVIIVLRYSATLKPSDLTRVSAELGQRLLGVIINFVPEPDIEVVGKKMTALFHEAGIKVLGVLPGVRNLLGISVADLVKSLDGEIVTCLDKTDEIVENVMLGAMTVNSGVDYFNRKENKAAVIRGERADMQLAALETSTRCLVLTNNTRPLPVVVFQAESKEVPVIVVKKDTSGAIAGIEQAFAKAAFNKPAKLKQFEGIMDNHLDFKSLCTVAGLKD